MIVYLFDGSFEGFLSAVYESYYKDYKPDAIYDEGNYQPRLTDQIFRVLSDSEKSKRVHKGILDKLGHEFYSQIIQAFLSEDLEGPSCIFYVVKKAFKEGSEIIFDLRDPQILKFKKLRTSVVRENHLMLGLVRFVVLKSDIYYAEIEPTYNQLPLLGDHFSQRMMNQRWVIHDLKRQMGLFYDKSSWYIQPIERTLNLELSEDEKMYQSLWKTFHKHVAIEARKSVKRQQAFIPNKYWKHLIEEKAKK